jgi:hypothetical protein
MAVWPALVPLSLDVAACIALREFEIEDTSDSSVEWLEAQGEQPEHEKPKASNRVKKQQRSLSIACCC